MAARMTEWQRRTLLAFASVFLSVVIFVLGYEAFQNIMYYRWKKAYDNHGWINRLTVKSDDPTLIWEYRPYGELNGGNYVVRTNRYGFRDFDYPSKDKPAGVYRIAFVGDSVTLGYGVQASDTFVTQIAALASSQTLGKKVETMNFGVDGYNTLQVSEMAKVRVMGFHPDLVVYVMCLNDFDFDDGSEQKIKYFHKPACFTVLLARQLWTLLQQAEYITYYFGKNKQSVFDSMVELKDFLHARRTDYMVTIVPVFFEYGPKPPKPREGYFQRYRYSQVHEITTRFLQGHGIAVHDLLDDFKKRTEAYDYFALDSLHLNPTGHRFVAQALLKPILSRISH
jgi:lysophospholipase L1-like esterase